MQVRFLPGLPFPEQCRLCASAWSHVCWPRALPEKAEIASVLEIRLHFLKDSTCKSFGFKDRSRTFPPKPMISSDRGGYRVVNIGGARGPPPPPGTPPGETPPCAQKAQATGTREFPPPRPPPGKQPPTTATAPSPPPHPPP